MVIGFSVDVEEKNTVPIVHVKGEIDIYTCPELRTALTKVVDSGHKKFILDLEHIHYIDSTGLGTIAHTARTIEEKQGHIFIISTKKQVKKIFEVSGLERKNITLHESENDAMKEIGQAHE